MLPYDSWVKFTRPPSKVKVVAHLLLQDNDHFSDGARGDELEAQSQGLASDLDVVWYYIKTKFSYISKMI